REPEPLRIGLGGKLLEGPGARWCVAYGGMVGRKTPIVRQTSRVVQHMADGDRGCLGQVRVPAGHRHREMQSPFFTEREDRGSHQTLRETIGEEQRRWLRMGKRLLTLHADDPTTGVTGKPDCHRGGITLTRV